MVLVWGLYVYFDKKKLLCWEDVPGSVIPCLVLCRPENKISYLIFSEISTEEIQIIGLQYLHCKSSVKKRKGR